MNSALEGRLCRTELWLRLWLVGAPGRSIVMASAEERNKGPPISGGIGLMGNNNTKEKIADGAQPIANQKDVAAIPQPERACLLALT